MSSARPLEKLPLLLKLDPALLSDVVPSSLLTSFLVLLLEGRLVLRRL